MTEIEEYTIRKATAADAEVISGIENEALCVAWSKNAISDAIGNENYVYLTANEKGSVIGSAGMLIASGDAEITNIAVTKSCRRRGIAQDLMQSLMDEALSRGCESVFLEVAEKNVPALSLYEKLGFTQIGTRKNYYRDPPDNAVIMKKSLT